MLSTSNHTNFNLNSPFLSTTTHRVWRRRRLKLEKKKLTVSCQLGPLNSSSFDNLFQNLISLIPSVNSLQLLAPTLGLTSGVALYLSQNKSNVNQEHLSSDIGEWILFTSPTPFNRFVLLRCPSIMFKESELLQDLNDKLVKEDRHFVKLLSGKIQVKDMLEGGEDDFEENLVYQRICIGTSDGGVISLDWPVQLDMKKEHGMDTTVLLIPGTPEGSSSKNVRSFVGECLKRGCFPVVMNPRGCAGSPLTTARLFTAADSDDICTAIQFINKTRPWNTLMAVGWGHAANMLTKYLAEVEEKTPLTAATCIDNPFDLEEATRSFPYHVAVDHKLTSGLIDILQSNKELFQGRAKGFDVEKALSATSLRDFEREISMVTYGFESIEEFYAKSSTREMIGSVKIPLLFIQSDDGTVPPFSIPRSSVAENPFTSMLLCSRLLSTALTGEKSVLPWCQHFAIEWLMSVELGLLKGRHPLLSDVDVTINPSAGLALVESRASNKDSRANNILDLPKVDVLNGHPVNEIEEYMTDNVPSGSQSYISEDGEPQERENHEMADQSVPDDDALVQEAGENNPDGEPQERENHEMADQSVPDDDALVEEAGENNPDDDALVEEAGENIEDTDRSQVLDSARVVMNMLDVTMPGTLQEEQKKKVLYAMEHGETLVKALEGAVPEDVRGTLTTALSEIVKIRRTNLNLDELKNISLVPSALPEMKSNIQETFKELSNDVVGDGGVGNSPDQMALGNEIPSGTDKKDSGIDKHPKELESDIQPVQALGGSFQDEVQPKGSHTDSVSSSNGKESELETDMGKQDFSTQRDLQSSSYGGSESGKDDLDPVVIEQEKVNQDDDTSQLKMEEANGVQTNKETKKDVSNEVKLRSTTKTEEALSPVTASPEPPLIKEDSDNFQKGEAENAHSMEDQSKQGPSKEQEPEPEPEPEPAPAPEPEPEPASAPEPAPEQAPAPAPAPTSASPSFNVSHALDALTGFDDSTQMAVNSVFGVLENMISKLEEGNGQERDEKQELTKDGEPSAASEEYLLIGKTENISTNKGKKSLASDQLLYGSHAHSDDPDKSADLDQCINAEAKQPPQSYSTLLEKGSGDFGRSNFTDRVEVGKKKRMNDMIDSMLSAKTPDKVAQISKLPLYVTVNPYGDPIYNEYLRCYLLSEMPKAKSLDLDSTADLLLDYIPEEGQWKLLDRTENDEDSDTHIRSQPINHRVQVTRSSPLETDTNEVIETSYVVLDTGKKQQPAVDYKTEDGFTEKSEGEDPQSQMVCAVKNIILDALKVEVGRKLGLLDMKEMESDLVLDLEHVAEVVSLEVCHRKEPIMSPENGSASGEFAPFFGEDIVQTIAVAVNDSVYLKKVLPVGVVVGSSLAAWKKYLSMVRQQVNDNGRSIFLNQNTAGKRLRGQVSEIRKDNKFDSRKHHYSDSDSSVEAIEEPNAVSDTIMAGAATTAALGASAFFAHQQSEDVSDVNVDVPPGSLNENKDQNNIGSSFGEKAMSVAAPVVPMKSDGGIDQERLLAMLSDLGQRGGWLRLISKLALLWGGIRGAVSLTDKLISFLRIADRPFLQRLLAFGCMVLVLWSPLVIPLFPTLVGGWATHNSSGIAEYACVIGLYTAVTILIFLWGKRIRGYEDPLEEYGLDLTSRAKLLDFFKGLMGGALVVLSIHSLNVLLGCAHFSWSSGLASSSPHAMALLKAFGSLLMLAGQGIVTATVVVIVEEILFRSWLPQEIALDFGYHQAIIISGFAFSIFQRSVRSIPGLWLLSIALSGLRQRNEGSLSIPIGVRAGILSSGFILQSGGFLTYHSSYPLWLAGRHPLQPFDGAVGLAFCILLAIFLYPRRRLRPLRKKTIQKAIRE